MRALIFDTEQQAKDWDEVNNSFTGSITKYKYSRKALNDTTVLTKAEYAALMGIPETITDDSDNQVSNPAYTSLDSSYTLNKCALIVGDDFDTYDEDGNLVEAYDTVDITEDDFYTNNDL